MTTRIYAPEMVWEQMGCYGEHAIIALDDTLRAWEHTPYESGQRFIQRGADCIGAIFGVIDDMDGRSRAQKPGMPHDASMHSRSTAIIAVRELVRRYSPCEKVLPDSENVFHVEPGDIVVTGMPGGGPGHVEIVGSRRNELWHALPSSGFHQGGWSFLEQQLLFAVFRIQDKHRWGQNESLA